jgi:hypothetical protein
MPSNLIRGPLQYTSTVTMTAAGNYTITNETVVVIRKGTGAATAVSLPTVSGAKDNGRTVVIKDGKADAATNNITITDPSSQTIDGAASLVISANSGKATLMYFWDGTTGRWAVIA